MCQAKSDYRILWAQLSGVKWGLESSKGVDADTAPGGLIMPGEWKIEEIRVQLSLCPICFSKIRLCRSPDIGGPHIATFRMRGVERYTKKPYTLEKSGLAVKEELEK